VIRDKKKLKADFLALFFFSNDKRVPRVDDSDPPFTEVAGFARVERSRSKKNLLLLIQIELQEPILGGDSKL
jgi:hypothetical protein